MSRTYKDSRAKYGRTNSAKEKSDRLAVIAVRRRPIDTKKLGQALLDLVTTRAEADAEASAVTRSSGSTQINHSNEPVDLGHFQTEDRT